MPKPVLPAAISVDFSKVEERRESGKAIHVPPGDYLARVAGCEQRSKKDDTSSKYLSWKLEIIKPEKYTGKGFIYFVTSLKEEALWNLRNFLEDLGVTVPKSIVKIPIKTIVEKKMVLGITVDDDEYNEKVKSKVQATFKKADYEATEEESDDDEDEDEAEPAAVAASVEETEEEDSEELDLEDL